MFSARQRYAVTWTGRPSSAIARVAAAQAAAPPMSIFMVTIDAPGLRQSPPESKVTAALSRQKKYGLHPVVILIDECQIAFTDETYGTAIERKVDDLVRRGPAAGIMIMLSTQKPDAKALPTGIRSNAVNADRIRTNIFAGGMVESRAAARGISVDEYFRSNLLGREVTARDVAESFAWLAQARATTGCVVTVDGGNAAAFPR